MEIGEAAELDAAMKGFAQPPATYVVLASERNVTSDLAAGCSAGTIQVFSVVTVVDRLNDVTGAEALDSLRPIRRRIRAALQGWSPSFQKVEAMTFLSGELVQFEGDGRLWWADEYAWILYTDL